MKAGDAMKAISVLTALFVSAGMCVSVRAADAPAAGSYKVKVSALQPGTGTQYYAAPDGKQDGDGSKDKPWDLGTAMKSTAIKGGDTLWLRGGTYKCTSANPAEKHPIVDCVIPGEKDKPIMVAQYPGERATLVGRLNVTKGAEYLWFWNFEISSTATNRTSKEKVTWPPSDLACNGFTISDNQDQDAPGIKCINMVVHDANYSGINLWNHAVEAELNGNIIYYNGWEGPKGEDRTHGHGIYTQNRNGVKKIRDNIMFKQFQIGIQMYGSGAAWVDNYEFVGNTSFQNGAAGGRLEINVMISPVNCKEWNFIIEDNHCYFSDLNRPTICIGYPFHKAPYEKITVNRNHFIGTTYLYWWKNLTASDNTLYGPVKEIPLEGSNLKFASFDRTTNKVLTEKPKGLEVFVRPNQYEAGRANIIIYNWDQQDAVDVDMKDLLPSGEAYEVRDVQNWFGEPVARGRYDGKPVSIPMKGLKVADPIGIKPYPEVKHTAPEFGVFVVRKTAVPSGAK
jgi:hypothetical protein